MRISDPHAPMSPYGKVGSIINVVFSAVAGAIAIIAGIATGTGGIIVVGFLFWAMCVFGFVPIMRRARAYDREHQDS